MLLGDRHPRQQRHQSQRRGPARDRRQQRHHRQAIDRQHDQSTRQAAKLRRKAEQPPASRCSLERERREADAAGNTTGRSRRRSTQQPSASKASRGLLHADEAWSAARARAAPPMSSLGQGYWIMSVQERHLPRRGSNRDAGIILPAAVPRRQSNVQNSHIHSANRRLKSRPLAASLI